MNSNFKFQISNSKSGFIFLEILIAVALVSVVFITLLGIGFLSLNLSSSIQATTQIDAMLREEVEAARSFRDGAKWSTNGLGTLLVSSANPYYLVKDTTTNPPKWNVVLGTENVNGFSRNIVFDKVSRDLTTNNIESTYNASHDDPDTRKITVSVTWNSKIYQVVTYLTNWQK